MAAQVGVQLEPTPAVDAAFTANVDEIRHVWHDFALERSTPRGRFELPTGALTSLESVGLIVMGQPQESHDGASFDWLEQEYVRSAPMDVTVALQRCPRRFVVEGRQKDLHHFLVDGGSECLIDGTMVAVICSNSGETSSGAETRGVGRTSKARTRRRPGMRAHRIDPPRGVVHGRGGPSPVGHAGRSTRTACPSPDTLRPARPARKNRLGRRAARSTPCTRPRRHYACRPRPGGRSPRSNRRRCSPR